MKHIVYKTTNKVNGYIYIGVHKTENPDIWDFYLGNEVYSNQPMTYKKSKTKFKLAVCEFGPQNFYRETLAIFDEPEPAYELERIIVNELFLARSDVYNMVLGGTINLPEGITTYIYDETGKYIRSCDSYESTAKYLKTDPTCVRRGILYKYRIKGHYLTNVFVDKIDIDDFNTNIPIVNYRYLKSGEFDKEFISLSEAAKASDTNTFRISDAIVTGKCVNDMYYFSTIKNIRYDIARKEYTKTRKVHKYAESGEYIESYDTQREAEEKNKGSNISKSINLKSVDDNGFMWSVVKLQNFNVPKHKRNKKVGEFSDDGKLLKTWPTAKACVKERGSGVLNVLCGRYEKHKGIIYKYL